MAGSDLSEQSVIHFAPEPYMGRILQRDFGTYVTADRYMQQVDHQVDLVDLPFPDAHFNAVVIVDVMMHIEDDQKAIAELFRILKPDGVAIVSVPIIAPDTIEYPETLEDTGGAFWRAPGLDYYDKFGEVFTRVQSFRSTDFPEQYQLYIYEDRSQWPNEAMPLRPQAEGERHLNAIGICYK